MLTFYNRIHLCPLVIERLHRPNYLNNFIIPRSKILNPIKALFAGNQQLWFVKEQR